MCTCNGASHLAAQLESLAGQTRLPDELVVCDDRSTDSTLEIVRRFAVEAPFHVHLHVNERRLGSTANFEQAIRLCRGDIIALCDQDDCWLQQKLQRMEAAFDDPKVGVVFSDAEIVDALGQRTGERLWTRFGLDATQRGLVEGAAGADVLLQGCFVTGACMAFRADFRDVVLPVPLDLPLIHDGWIAAIIAAVAAIRGIDEPLVLYRQHSGQQIGIPVREKPERGARAALRRNNAFPDQIAVAERVLQRLTSQVGRPMRPGVAARINGRIQHLHARLVLPDQPLKRVPGVVVELITGRYHRYSKGIASAAKDMLPAR